MTKENVYPITGLETATPTKEMVESLELWSGAVKYKDLRNLTSDLLMPKLTEMGIGAFKGCTHLGMCVFNNNMQEIPKYAFQDCKRLNGVFFVDDSYTEYTTIASPSRISVIGEYAFSNCKQLSNEWLVYILKYINTIKKSAFANSKVFVDVTKDDNGNEQIFKLILSKHVKMLEDGALSCKFFNMETGKKITKLDIMLTNVNPSELIVGENVFDSTTDIYLMVPEGTADVYKQKFTQSNIISITEYPLNDSVWDQAKQYNYM